MKFGFIGSGRVAQAVAKYLVAAGHQVLMSNSRGPGSLSDIIHQLGPHSKAVEVQEAAKSDVVFLAIPWLKISDTLKTLPHWGGRILVDATNEFLDFNDLALRADLKGRASSEYVADLAPGALVVKAINNLFSARFAEGPLVDNARRITFISGDSAKAKAQIGSLLESFGFAVIDLGSLHDGGRMQQASGPLAGLDLLQGN
ncbi:NAD(P)-binding domain-containing protein [Pseudomonas sp. 10B1]|uniref:NADPH-dependent F420 reductase n=1 Tax=unclassified Pseudomonas TaxID=196821 RepID=UPI002AB5A400|nr:MULTISPECIES: NAD(P)-binding domain-containing protein [unclassified Pseudomonas]MDY7562569.1 NAD(P)-binding domain-containing protein [Pseudomonas sp. AB6]MEA9979639.1 NAD(P)-binding domain-containing protein [Pseudomonas sp. RTS4]MEA9997302.1 NAD(P)-binding domain-containing protein [Pseudomonas sp. AA4]MEB0086519.1 NAD(P)-binding domain-containing protein [Pseudomonas sp. RTI1]MEB0128498.1 NAD(P)-binding domain-containing protein [Pseudomonas sp. CCC1.2]